MYTTNAFGAQSAASPLAQLSIPRRDLTDRDVQIEITHCGVCHSDLHVVRDEWSKFRAIYPVVPGHEAVGRVTKVGSGVTRHTIGDLVAVGVFVDSCRSCAFCRSHQEHLCATHVLTYNTPDPHGTAPVTYGGYSSSIVVDEAFVFAIPSNLDPAGAAPLLCAGITTWAPIKRAGVGPGKKVGIVGLGGLGHMGVKFSRALGAETVVFTTSKHKMEDAIALGAHRAVLSTDAQDMAKHAGSCDFILDCVSAKHDVGMYLDMLAPNSNMTMVGLPEEPFEITAFQLMLGQKSLSGSGVGGNKETEEMLAFCGTHNITSTVEVIAIQQVNEAYERMVRSDVKYRFCIDMASLRDG